jgi:hypothetical protein
MWSYYFNYKSIKNINVQHKDISFWYNNSIFFQTFSKPTMFDLFSIKHIIFGKKDFCMIFFCFFFKFGVMESLVEFH